MSVQFEDEQESGSSLRQKLEAALAENKALKAKQAELVAKDVIRDKGLSLVKPEDLADVAPEEIEAKAAELQKAKEAEMRSTIRTVLAQKGVAEDDLDEAVDDFLSGGSETDEFEDVNEAIRIAGEPAPKIDPGKLDSFGKLQYALAPKGRRK